MAKTSAPPKPSGARVKTPAVFKPYTAPKTTAKKKATASKTTSTGGYVKTYDSKPGKIAGTPPPKKTTTAKKTTAAKKAAAKKAPKNTIAAFTPADPGVSADAGIPNRMWASRGL